MAQVDGSGTMNGGGLPPPPTQPSAARQLETSNCFSDLKFSSLGSENVIEAIATPALPAGSSTPRCLKSPKSLFTPDTTNEAVLPSTPVTLMSMVVGVFGVVSSICPRMNSPSQATKLPATGVKVIDVQSPEPFDGFTSP